MYHTYYELSAASASNHKATITSPKVTTIDTELAPSPTKATTELLEKASASNVVIPSPKVNAIDAELSPSPAKTTSKPAKTQKSNNGDQNRNQNKVNLPVGAITTSDDTESSSADTQNNTTSQIVAIPKTFKPKKIIGFSHTCPQPRQSRRDPQRRFNRSLAISCKCVVDFFFYPNSEMGSRLFAKLGYA